MISVGELKIFKDARDILNNLNLDDIDNSYQYLDLKKGCLTKEYNVYSLKLGKRIRQNKCKLIDNRENIFYYDIVNNVDSKNSYSLLSELLNYPIALLDDPFSAIFNSDLSSLKNLEDLEKMNFQIKTEYYCEVLLDYFESKDHLTLNDKYCIMFLNKQYSDRISILIKDFDFNYIFSDLLLNTDLLLIMVASDSYIQAKYGEYIKSIYY